MQRVACGVGNDPVGKRDPAGGLLARWTTSCDPSQAGRADQSAVGPGVGFELPDTRVQVRLGPPVLDRFDRDLGCSPSVDVEVVVLRRRREQEQRLSEGVELELLVDPVADDVGATGISRQRQFPFVRNLASLNCVGGLERGPVAEQPLGDEADRIVHQRMRPGGRDRLAGVRLVADPCIAIVVATAFAGPLRQRRRRGGDHTAAQARQAGHHGVRMPGIAVRDYALELGDTLAPGRLGALPCTGRIGHFGLLAGGGEGEHEVVRLSFLECKREGEGASAVSVGAQHRALGAGPGEAALAEDARPGTVDRAA